MTDYESELKDSFWTVLREGGATYGGGGRLAQTYERLSSRLRELDVDHALVGGYALILHGVRRFTEDVDLLVTREGLEKLRSELIGAGYTSIPGNQRDIRDPETGVRIEFVVSGDFPGDGKAKPVSFPVPADVCEEREGVCVVALETLIELKLASGMTAKGRLQDLADVQRLIQQHHLTGDFSDRLDPYVRQKFRELIE
ncbi:MAG: nucleotidyl transferase AbiEii/AbiGii toxin family protein [Verrucomicrobia bacterium]|nr:nucleotidyl transferase AbiEii/AbiGii toxin family protein [Verrucomicrobiota bacterium]MDA1088646.1 nucleotidyl transferase AbiEii/AbiGii toxin family protein [Verrucomicrobiota bacterium]